MNKLMATTAAVSVILSGSLMASVFVLFGCNTVAFAKETSISQMASDLGYEYLGGESFKSTLYSGSGHSIDIPVGVLTGDYHDYDGDGDPELMLVLVEESERCFGTEGNNDGLLAFAFYEKESDGRYSLSRKIVCNAESGCLCSIAEMISQITIFRAGDMIIVLDQSLPAIVQADNENVFGIRYDGTDGTLLPGDEYGEELQVALNGEQVILGTISVPEFYPFELINLVAYDQLFEEGSLDVIIEYDDNGCGDNVMP